MVRRLEGQAPPFRDVILTDSTVVTYHDLLEKRFRAYRTKTAAKAALKAHTIMSVRGVGEQSIKITARAPSTTGPCSASVRRPPA